MFCKHWTRFLKILVSCWFSCLLLVAFIWTWVIIHPLHTRGQGFLRLFWNLVLAVLFPSPMAFTSVLMNSRCSPCGLIQNEGANWQEVCSNLIYLGNSVNPECGALAVVIVGLPEFRRTWQLGLYKPWRLVQKDGERTTNNLEYLGKISNKCSVPDTDWYTSVYVTCF